MYLMRFTGGAEKYRFDFKGGGDFSLFFFYSLSLSMYECATLKTHVCLIIFVLI